MGKKTTRAKSRILLLQTSIFHFLVALCFLVDSLHLPTFLEPSTLWSGLFIFTSILCLFAWVNKEYTLAKWSYIGAGVLSLIFATTFAIHLVAGDIRFALAVVVWGYLGGAYLEIAKAPDPFLVDLVREEEKSLSDLLQGREV